MVVLLKWAFPITSLPTVLTWAIVDHCDHNNDSHCKHTQAWSIQAASWSVHVNSQYINVCILCYMDIHIGVIGPWILTHIHMAAPLCLRSYCGGFLELPHSVCVWLCVCPPLWLVLSIRFAFVNHWSAYGCGDACRGLGAVLLGFAWKVRGILTAWLSLRMHLALLEPVVNA